MTGRCAAIVGVLMWLAPPVSPARGGVDFDTQIVPVLTKLGCNAGACHGAAAGKGGFHLSLWGADADSDYDAIVRQREGRRVNLSHAERSLIYLKPSENVEHGGGLKLRRDTAAERLMLQWLAQGAPRGGGRRITHFTVAVSAVEGDAGHSNILENVGMSAVLRAPGAAVRLHATARFEHTDSAARGDDDAGGRVAAPVDVTDWTVFTPDDPAAVKVTAAGVATVNRRGQHVVLARFLDRIVAVQLTVPLRDGPVDLSAAPRRNFIDGHVLAALSTLRLPPSPQSDDAAFLRRASLDLTGRLPTPQRIAAFLDDDDPHKRRKLIDELLASPGSAVNSPSNGFVDLWTYRLATLFQINSKRLDKDGAAAFHGWLREQVESNRPFDALARDVLTASGDAHERGPANFARIEADPRLQAEFVTQSLMAVRLRCANCHDHPLDVWKQDDYHGLAAVFAKVRPGRIVELNPRGQVTHPVTGEPAQPRIPGVRDLQHDDGEGDHRAALAAWLTQPDNPFFARAIVNRLWADMMGRGLVEPVDDHRATNPPTHPQLLDALAADFIKHGHDLRRTLRLIANSAAYQRSSEPTDANRVDDRFYAHARIKPMPAEVLLDAVADATGVYESFDGKPRGTRAVALEDPLLPSRPLDVLGRCPRQDACDADVATAAGIERTLHLINGPLLNRRVTDRNGRLHRLLADGRDNDAVITELYLATLSRPPTQRESNHWRNQLKAAADDTDRRARLEDLFWALLCSEAFTMNH